MKLLNKFKFFKDICAFIFKLKYIKKIYLVFIYHVYLGMNIPPVHWDWERKFNL
jgi:uncharacterized radical SAM superfamily protein